MVGAIFQKKEIRVIACNDKFENDYIMGRNDRGISRISDLKRKRIGVALKTINEFYLGRFPALNGMNIRDVAFADLAPEQFVKAIAGGDVDAIIAWQPYIDRIERSRRSCCLAGTKQPGGVWHPGLRQRMVEGANRYGQTFFGVPS